MQVFVIHLYFERWWKPFEQEESPYKSEDGKQNPFNCSHAYITDLGAIFIITPILRSRSADVILFRIETIKSFKIYLMYILDYSDGEYIHAVVIRSILSTGRTAMKVILHVFDNERERNSDLGTRVLSIYSYLFYYQRSTRQV